MDLIARYRIRKDGRTYRPGERISLSEEELVDLPEDALSAAPDRADEIRAALKALPPEHFRKDGFIRASGLRELSEKLGFLVTEEEVNALIEAAD